MTAHRRSLLAEIEQSEHDPDFMKQNVPVNLASISPGASSSFYAPVEEYEGYHRYDPNAEWTPAAENAVRRKVDWKIMLWACIMFWSLQIDRGNIKQAISDNMLNDLGMTTDNYNTGMTIFYVACKPTYVLEGQCIDLENSYVCRAAIAADIKKARS